MEFLPTVHWLVPEGSFHPPMNLGENITAWRLEDVETWEKSRLEVVAWSTTSDPKRANP
jgi:predicted DNA-binding transcriptional regulator AlpA